MLSVFSPSGWVLRDSKIKYVFSSVDWNICLWVKNVNISTKSSKTEFGLQNRFGLVIYPSIGNYIWSKKKYTLGGQKGKKKPSEPINGILAP
jgi:hypothetical protein